jgi:hypothetical protein
MEIICFYAFSLVSTFLLDILTFVKHVADHHIVQIKGKWASVTKTGVLEKLTTMLCV